MQRDSVPKKLKRKANDHALTEAHRAQAKAGRSELSAKERCLHLFTEITKRFDIAASQIEKLYHTSTYYIELGHNLGIPEAVLREIHVFWDIDFVEIKAKSLSNPKRLLNFNDGDLISDVQVKELGINITPAAFRAYMRRSSWKRFVDRILELAPVESGLEQNLISEQVDVGMDDRFFDLLQDLIAEQSEAPEAVEAAGAAETPPQELEVLEKIGSPQELQESEAPQESVTSPVSEVQETPTLLIEKDIVDNLIAASDELFATLPRNLDELIWGDFLAILTSGLRPTPVFCAKYFGCKSEQFFTNYFNDNPLWKKFGIHRFDDLFCLSEKTRTELAQFSDTKFVSLSAKLGYSAFAPTNRERIQILDCSATLMDIKVKDILHLSRLGITIEKISYTYGEYPVKAHDTIKKLLKTFGLQNLFELHTMLFYEQIKNISLCDLSTWVDDENARIQSYLQRQLHTEFISFIASQWLSAVSSGIFVTPQRLAAYFNLNAEARRAVDQQIILAQTTTLQSRARTYPGLFQAPVANDKQSGSKRSQPNQESFTDEDEPAKRRATPTLQYDGQRLFATNITPTTSPEEPTLSSTTNSNLSH